MTVVRTLTIAGISMLMSAPAFAGPDDFVVGKTIPEYGKIAAVDVDRPVKSYSKFKVAFDTA